MLAFTCFCIIFFRFMHHSLCFTSRKNTDFSYTIACNITRSFVCSAHAGHAGPVTCRKPILSTRVPAYCDVHMQLGQMHLTRALQGAGLNISYASQVQPQLHHLIAEFVRQIQAKRRKVRTEEECKSVVKKEDGTAEG